MDQRWEMAAQVAMGEARIGGMGSGNGMEFDGLR